MANAMALVGQASQLQRIAILGNHLPRQCGIATFTTDLSEAISVEFPRLGCFVLAMNDAGRRHAYGARVRFEIAASDISSYRRAADFLNVNQVDVVSVQHEYGIFGGKAGAHLLTLLGDLRMPIVTTLHTVLPEPSAQQRLAMDGVARLSERLVVMSAGGAALMRDVHGVPAERIDLIPHGIPSLPSAERSKHELGVEGKQVILTFGLLSPDKGIEHMLDSMPAVLERYPNVLYIVLGATHPHVKERDGETYRFMLEDRARRLGIAASVLFHNRFVEQEELTKFLAAADIYITPYLNPEQTTSGTLAYAVGAGKAVISTPYAYARELLSDGRGILVPWPKDDPGAISSSVISILSDATMSTALRKRAAAHGHDMLWPEVARSYVRSFEQARIMHSERRRTVFHAKTLADRPLELPEINLAHLCSLSDQTGLLQHAAFSVPRYEDGYCLDDNARALLLMTRLEDAGVDDEKQVSSLASRYLAFVSHAFDVKSGRFRNCMTYSRQWVEECGSDDSHGRALWALGSVVGTSGDVGRRSLADSLFHAGLPRALELASPRAWAYTLLGIDEYLRAFGGDSKVQSIREQFASQLLALYQRTSRPRWRWFEEQATYGNARLCQALIVSGAHMDHAEMKAAGLQSLSWLSEMQRSSLDGAYFAPIGSNGFYTSGGTKAAFDQQPLEACAMVSACLEAERITVDGRWTLEARRAFSWFLGQNELQQSLYDARTGACRDGLHADRLNENRGAESTLSFMMALVEMRAVAQLGGLGGAIASEAPSREVMV